MGSSIDCNISEFDQSIDDYIEVLLEYKKIINELNTDDDKFVHRSKEIFWSFESVKKQIHRLKQCIEKGDFSYTREEQEFYSRRMLFLLSLI